MERQYSLPLFPLNTVLFPGMPLPLHIFEDRYKRMINECIDKQQPFGVALIREGREVGRSAEPHLIGTSAIITDVSRLPDGRLDIVTVGYQRFRILTLIREQPYLSGLVELLPPVDEETAEAHVQARALQPLLKDYVELLAELTETKIELTDIPSKPVLLAYLTAILLHVPRSDKQSLLAAETIPRMLAREILFLRREMEFLAARIGAELVSEGRQVVFSKS